MSILFNNGSGFGVNPTSNFLPYNNNGNFSDSIFYNYSSGQGVYCNDINLNTSNGFICDFQSKIYRLGDFSNALYKCYFDIDVNSKTIQSFMKFGGFGFKISDVNSIILGDTQNFNNSTTFKIDDQNQRIEFSTNLRSATAGVAALQYLKVRVAGVDYKIALLNP